MNNKTEKTPSLGNDIIALLRERWQLFTVLLAFLLLLALVVAYFLMQAQTRDTECVMRLLVETESGGSQWLTVKPKNGEPAGVAFEEPTFVHRVEIDGCR